MSELEQQPGALVDVLPRDLVERIIAGLGLQDAARVAGACCTLRKAADVRSSQYSVAARPLCSLCMLQSIAAPQSQRQAPRAQPRQQMCARYCSHKCASRVLFAGQPGRQQLCNGISHPTTWHSRADVAARCCRCRRLCCCVQVALAARETWSSCDHNEVSHMKAARLFK